MPVNFGDSIENVMGVKEVVATKQNVNGFMVSKIGIYYRTTSPVFNGKKFIGFVSFGVGLGYVNDYIKEKLHTHSAIVVKTDELKKSKWYDMLEEGSIGKYTVISSSGEIIEKLPKGINLDEKNIQIEIDDKVYNLINTIEIKNLYKKPIAKVILLQDITQLSNAYKRYLYSFSVVLVLLLVVMSFILIRTFNQFLTTIWSINKDLEDLNKSLEQKVKEEVEKNREKDKQIYENQKLAHMGETYR